MSITGGVGVSKKPADGAGTNWPSIIKTAWLSHSIW
jgi:hypothetical protein